MSARSSHTDLEPVIWARLIRPQSDPISPEAAQYLLSVTFGEGNRARMLELADKSEAGALSVEELAEYDSYLYIGNLLAVK